MTQYTGLAMEDMETGKAASGKDRKMYNKNGSLKGNNSKEYLEGLKERTRKRMEDKNFGSTKLANAVAKRDIFGSWANRLSKAVHDPANTKLKASGGSEDKHLAEGFELCGGAKGLGGLADDMVIEDSGDKSKISRVRQALTGKEKAALGFVESDETKGTRFNNLNEDAVFKFTRPADWKGSDKEEWFKKEYDYEPEPDSDSEDSDDSDDSDDSS